MFAAGLVQPIKFVAFAETVQPPRQVCSRSRTFRSIPATDVRSHCHAGAAAHVRRHRRTGPAAPGCRIIVPVQLG